MRKVAVAAIISLAAGCDGGPTGPTVDVPVSGRVLDYATGAGPPGAAVAFGASTALTDTNGSYSLVVPEIGHFEPVIDGRTVGSIRVTGAAYRGDFFVHGGICVARYGTVTDARTLRPIDGAVVSLGGQRAVTGVDGWYRLDLGCPTDSPLPGLRRGPRRCRVEAAIECVGFLQRLAAATRDVAVAPRFAQSAQNSPLKCPIHEGTVVALASGSWATHGWDKTSCACMPPVGSCSRRFW
jgi:hypothetical protein